jgi:hypothetical protein
MAAAAIFSKKVAAGGPAAAFGPYLVGVLVWSIGLSLGGTTGYAINLARDLTDLSQFGDSDLAKPFRISERHAKVFTTARGISASLKWRRGPAAP